MGRVGKEVSLLVPEKTTGVVLKELEQGSNTLVKLGVAFPKWLSHQAGKPETKVEVVCFFEELSSSVGGKSIGKVRRLRSATADERRFIQRRSCLKSRQACEIIQPSPYTPTIPECANSATIRMGTIREKLRPSRDE